MVRRCATSFGRESFDVEFQALTSRRKPAPACLSERVVALHTTYCHFALQGRPLGFALCNYVHADRSTWVPIARTVAVDSWGNSVSPGCSATLLAETGSLWGRNSRSESLKLPHTFPIPFCLSERPGRAPSLRPTLASNWWSFLWRPRVEHRVQHETLKPRTSWAMWPSHLLRLMPFTTSLSTYGCFHQRD